MLLLLYSLLDVSELDVRADSVVEGLLLAVAHQLLLPHLQHKYQYQYQRDKVTE